MDKNTFLSIDIDNQIEYLNNELSKGLTVGDIRKNLSIGEKTFLKLISNGGYKYNQKSRNYIKVTEVVQGYNNNQSVVGENSNQLVVNGAEYQKLIDTMKNIQGMNDKLEEVYKWYELQNNIIEKVNLSIEPNNNDTVTRSFKVYEDVYKDFMELSKKHSTYKVQDLISQAIKEFCNKYK